MDVLQAGSYIQRWNADQAYASAFSQTVAAGSSSGAFSKTAAGSTASLRPNDLETVSLSREALFRSSEQKTSAGILADITSRPGSGRNFLRSSFFTNYTDLIRYERSARAMLNDALSGNGGSTSSTQSALSRYEVLQYRQNIQDQLFGQRSAAEQGIFVNAFA
jgi:hypothetical protein